jgi:hypothetical protein
MKNLIFKKFAWLVALVGVFIFSGAIFFQLQTAFSWANPSPGCSPPNCSGALFYDSTNNRLGVNTNLPADTFSVNGAINAFSSSNTPNLIHGVATPVAGTDAVNKDYLQNYVAAQVSGGGGAMVLYYKTVSNFPQSSPTCPTGWATTTIGYGPHYLAVAAHDWQNSNAPGGGGGFTSGIPSPYEPGGLQGVGSSYVLRSVAIGSDSVCSESQTSVVPFSDIYNNVLSSSYGSLRSNACFTDTSTGVTECNRCLVCQK